MRLLVTGATGFLGWRAATLLAERGHDIAALTRPGRAARAASAGLDAIELDAGDPAARALVAGRVAVLHFAGVPDPAGAREREDVVSALGQQMRRPPAQVAGGAGDEEPHALTPVDGPR